MPQNHTEILPPRLYAKFTGISDVGRALKLFIIWNEILSSTSSCGGEQLTHELLFFLRRAEQKKNLKYIIELYEP